MLRPKFDRLDYGKLLTPPYDGEGKFSLEFAIGTTYSLDLDALIAASIALGAAGDTDDESFLDSVFLLDILRRTCKKTALFCESIHAPRRQPTPLYTLLENTVFQVTTKADGEDSYPAFHPKVWIISYACGKAKRYRVVVMSRNLTFDRSWDVAVAFDGRPCKKRNAQTEPLKRFIEYLAATVPHTTAGDEKRAAMLAVAKELAYVEFDTKLGGNDFSVDFIPLGIGRRAPDYPLFTDEQVNELFVISPFLSKTFVRRLNGRAHGSAALISRPTALAALDRSDCDKFDVYCVNHDAIYDESADERDNADSDVHAKLYMMHGGTEKRAQLYLGSMNASYSGSERNVEFMVRLRCSHKVVNFRRLFEDILGKDHEKGAFEKYDFDNKNTESADDTNDVQIKRLCRAGATAVAQQTGECYTVTVTVPSIDGLDGLTVSPLFIHRETPIATTTVFDGLPLSALSEFYLVATSGEKRVKRIVSIPTYGIPEERDEQIIKTVISDKNKLYAFLEYALGDDPIVGALDGRRVLSGEGVGDNGSIPVALYEKMLVAAANEPQKLRDIKYVTDAVEGGDALDALIKTFLGVVGNGDV